MSLVNVFQAQSDTFFKIVLKYSQYNVTTEPSQNHNCIAHYINNTIIIIIIGLWYGSVIIGLAKKVCLGFSIPTYEKIQMNFLTNPIFIGVKSILFHGVGPF